MRLLGRRVAAGDCAVDAGRDGTDPERVITPQAPGGGLLDIGQPGVDLGQGHDRTTGAPVPPHDSPHGGALL